MMTELTKSIGSLRSLTELHLAGGKRQMCMADTEFANGRLRALPPAIGNLAAVRTLTVEGFGDLKTLPDSMVKMTSLRTLYIARCPNLDRLPASLKRAQALRTLHLYEFHTDILKTVEAITSLRVLCLTMPGEWTCDYRRRESPQADADVVLGCVRRMPHLTRLIVDWNSCKVENMPECIGLLIGLEELVMKNISVERLPASFFHAGLSLKKMTLTFSAYSDLQELPASLGHLTTLQELVLSAVGLWGSRPRGSRLQELPASFVLLTTLRQLTIEYCRELRALPAGLGQLGALKQLTLCYLDALQSIPDASVCGLTSLESLKIKGCDKLNTLPASIGQLGALKELTLESLPNLQEMLDVSRLTSLESLTMTLCKKLKALSTSMGQLGALKQLTVCNLHELQAMPDTLGKMTALERLTLIECDKLKALPESIMHLSRLQHLQIKRCPLQDMPCIEALTALRTLALDVADYTHSNRTFTALSRSLPCLQQLDALHLSGFAEPDQYGIREREALRIEDVLSIGRALRAWPLPLLHNVPDDDIRLSTCWQALGLPAAAADWRNATTLEYFRVQQHKMAAFASGMHARLGAGSGLSGLDEQTLVMIADEVLGGWGLLREWRQKEGAGGGGGSC